MFSAWICCYSCLLYLYSILSANFLSVSFVAVYVVTVLWWIIYKTWKKKNLLILRQNIVAFLFRPHSKIPSYYFNTIVRSTIGQLVQVFYYQSVYSEFLGALIQCVTICKPLACNKWFSSKRTKLYLLIASGIGLAQSCAYQFGIFYVSFFFSSFFISKVSVDYLTFNFMFTYYCTNKQKKNFLFIFTTVLLFWI